MPNAGLKTFVSVQSTRRLSNHDSATVAVTWAPRAGFGLSLTASRQLSPLTEADWTWQVGPEGVMGLGITRRGEKYLLSGRLEVRGPAHGSFPCCCCALSACFCLRSSRLKACPRGAVFPTS